MTSQFWWDRFPDRLIHEQQALECAGIRPYRDNDAFKRGILRWHIEVPWGGENIQLRVTFPDSYPYFRFQIEAPSLDLKHHQHPFGKHLCLIGRATHYWRMKYTVAMLLQERLQIVLESGEADNCDAARGLELQQAEPYSDYYPYVQSMVIVPSVLPIPAESEYGTFVVAPIDQPGQSHQLLRGMMTELRAAGELILSIPRPSICSGSTLNGLWVRASQPIPHCESKRFWKEILRRLPGDQLIPPNNVSGGWLQLCAVVFPEETGWRSTESNGLVFVCHFSTEMRHLLNVTSQLQRDIRRHSK